jgi:pyruvate dehydrogenase E2 component (dihydrolipoamide acetyltransferase)
MPFEITLPRLGWDMEEGSLSSWLKEEGEYVQAGELLFSVEGDKAVQEIEALDSGYLRILPTGPQPGQIVPVGTLIGYLVPESELATFQLQGEPQSQAATTPPAPAGLAAASPSATEPNGGARTAAETQPAVPPRPRRVYISPYARRMADGLGIDWQAIQGSGLGGRIMAKDIEGAAAQSKTAPGLAVPALAQPVTTIPAIRPAAEIPAAASRQVMTPLRRKIAESMAGSAHTTAPVTLTTEADATELVALRRALKEDAGDRPVPSYNDLLAKLSAQALLEHPLMNARLEGDEIVQPGSVNISIAVDTERGLIVPVLRDVQTKTLRQLAAESSTLIEKSRLGTVSYEDLHDGTFTITNLGMYEIDAFTPIINLPQCAVLGVGRIIPKQVVIDAEAGQVAIRQRMFLSLTFDHRLVDGAQAARFLQRVLRFIERPYLWMAG